jgi:ElaB/YqjD/DUF883 family membrane-anchored ribosome-binding protein
MASSKQFGSTGNEGSVQHEQKQPRTGTELGRSMARMAETLEDTGSQAAATFRDARQMAEEQAEALMGWIKQRPLTSVLIGAAVGYLFGRMARR